MASMNLRILGKVAAHASGAWNAGQKTPSGGGPDSSPVFQDALEGAKTPKTPLAPYGSPATSAQTPTARTPAGSPMKLAPTAAFGALGEKADAAEQLPRLLGRQRPAPAAARAGARAHRAQKVKFEEDPAMLAAQAREAFLARRQRLAERRSFMQGSAAFQP